MRGDRERGDKGTKTQVPRSKYQIPSLNFMKVDKATGNRATVSGINQVQNLKV